MGLAKLMAERSILYMMELPLCGAAQIDGRKGLLYRKLPMWRCAELQSLMLGGGYSIILWGDPGILQRGAAGIDGGKGLLHRELPLREPRSCSRNWWWPGGKGPALEHFILWSSLSLRKAAGIYGGMSGRLLHGDGCLPISN